MNQTLPVMAILAGATACGPADRTENSAICGITMLAAATRIIEQIDQPLSALTQPPAELQGIVPARVVGYGTSPAMAGEAEDGKAVVGFSGDGFPAQPGFGVALVDDSSEVFRGILIWDKAPPPDHYPTIGTIADANTVMPLIGIRINWGSVNSDRCPLFADVSAPTP